MTATAALLVAATSAYAGFQATVRVVVYPQFRAVSADRFVAYEARHQRLITYVVGPLFVLDGTACVVAFVRTPGLPAALAGASIAAVIAITSLFAVPCHRALSTGFDVAVHRRLLRVDSVRLAVAVLGVGAACWYAAGA